ncbi:MAG: hypothetical protein ACRC62_08510 [Microcoleus sp.]
MAERSYLFWHVEQLTGESVETAADAKAALGLDSTTAIGKIEALDTAIADWMKANLPETNRGSIATQLERCPICCRSMDYCPHFLAVDEARTDESGYPALGKDPVREVRNLARRFR